MDTLLLGPPAAGATLADLLRDGSLDLPLPGHGDTALRWSVLTGWGRTDLVLARLAEGHTDAVAILAEAGGKPVPDARYGVWAARSGGTGAVLVDGAVHGTVRFCSGAHTLDRALVVTPDGIVDVELSDPRVRPVEGSWRPAGMAASDSVDVVFDGVPAGAVIGAPGFYTDRPGFCWGGGGVAAVWLGGAAGVVDDVREHADDPHGLTHLGALHTALAGTDALLARTAAGIDADPAADHATAVAIVRASAEHTARAVLDLAPRLAGATVLSRHERLGDRLADLGVYVRQHHAERDLAALGARLVEESA
ncbi:acyl-CoA dehydrogenase family protein [Pseudonocardia sp.]|uniref:acyl-CoA dehydrogenase family protein n=1 Tax=Pseudonocardia sp. TaxID=60912 RepID=UPI00262AA52F|nr:acyl-CoA dehydrogenase family protein [Pseudonocardia sp.]